MAVIEVGTWNVRSGYIGDVACTHQLRSLCNCTSPKETELISILKASLESGESGFSKRHETIDTEGAFVQEKILTPLWTIESLIQNSVLHVDYLYHLKCNMLRCRTGDPLMLVIPELWHERLDVMNHIFEAILERSELTRLLYCGRPSVGWAFSCAKTSAVVLDVGHSHSTVAAMLDGYVLRRTIKSAEIGGKTVSERLSKMLKRDLYSRVSQRYDHLLASSKGTSTGDMVMFHLFQNFINDVKRLFGFVKNADFSPPDASLVRAPDGTLINLSSDQRSSPFEVLFGGDESFRCDVTDLLVSCKDQLDVEWRLEGIDHILGGAGSRVCGFRERILTEAKSLDSSYYRYERDNAFMVTPTAEGAWVGNSIAAASSSFDSLWVSKDEWDEEGESCLYRKLFH